MNLPNSPTEIVALISANAADCRVSRTMDGSTTDHPVMPGYVRWTCPVGIQESKPLKVFAALCFEFWATIDGATILPYDLQPYEVQVKQSQCPALFAYVLSLNYDQQLSALLDAFTSDEMAGVLYAGEFALANSTNLPNALNQVEAGWADQAVRADFDATPLGTPKDFAHGYIAEILADTLNETVWTLTQRRVAQLIIAKSGKPAAQSLAADRLNAANAALAAATTAYDAASSAASAARVAALPVNITTTNANFADQQTAYDDAVAAAQDDPTTANNTALVAAAEALNAAKVAEGQRATTAAVTASAAANTAKRNAKRDLLVAQAVLTARAAFSTIVA